MDTGETRARSAVPTVVALVAIVATMAALTIGLDGERADGGVVDPPTPASDDRPSDTGDAAPGPSTTTATTVPADRSTAYACRETVFTVDPSIGTRTHVSSLAEAPGGALVSTFLAGTGERGDDVATHVARKGRQSDEFRDEGVLFNAPGMADANPVLWAEPGTDALHVFLSSVVTHDPLTTELRRSQSTDGGRTWSTPVTIAEGDDWLFGTSPIKTSGGRTIVPIYGEESFRTAFLVSDDDLATWRIVPSPDPDRWLNADGGVIQAAIVELVPGRLLALLRSGSDLGVLFRTESTDGGETWSSPEPTDLPNPNARVALLQTSTGRLVLAWNPTAEDRSVLQVSSSTDGGRTWPDEFIVERQSDGVFEYPYLIEASDGMLHLSYTYEIRSIRHLAFTESYLRHGPDLQRLDNGALEVRGKKAQRRPACRSMADASPEGG